jgi:acetyl esterase/lipase
MYVLRTDVRPVDRTQLGHRVSTTLIQSVTVRIDRAVVYAEREGYRALELDLYRPTDASGGPPPLVVYIHGGGWRQSHRSRAPRETRGWDRGVFERLTDAGFAVAAPDYRLSSEAIFPAQRDDVGEAVRWLRQHGDEFGIDVERTFLWGASAGGQLAALAALTADANPVAGVVCWYAISDFSALDQTATDSFEAQLLGGPIGEHRDQAAAASPISHVHRQAPPFLLQHGAADSWVPCDQSVRFAERLRGAGVPVELEIMPGADHFFEGAPDVEAIFERSVGFLLTLSRSASASRSGEIR